MGSPEAVLDPGPIPYKSMDLYGDPDLEQGLRHAGFDPQTTNYRLIEIRLDAIAETASMPEWRRMGTGYADALRAGAEFPPVVVIRTAEGWGLLDGVNRCFAYWIVGTTVVRAYELLT